MADSVLLSLFTNGMYRAALLTPPVRGNNFFPFRVDPFSEMFWCAGKQTGVQSYIACYQSTDSTGGSIVSECGPNGDIKLFHLILTTWNLSKQF